MMYKTIATAVVLTAGSTLFALHVGADPSPIQPTTQVGQGTVPPVELRFGKRGTPRWIESEGSITIVASAKYLTVDKKVVIKWRIKDTSETAELETPLSFWPTEFINLQPGKMCVAGKDRGNRTLIQILEYVAPLPVVNQTTGAISLGPGVVTDVDELYRQQFVGRDMVQWIRTSRHSSGEAFVRFWDSRDIYKIDLTTGAIDIQVSPAPSSGGLTVPEAIHDYENCGTYVHVSRGYLYVLRDYLRQTPTLVLRDSNMDGDIDAYDYCDGNLWETLGYSQRSDYIWQ